MGRHTKRHQSVPEQATRTKVFQNVQLKQNYNKLAFSAASLFACGRLIQLFFYRSPLILESTFGAILPYWRFNYYFGAACVLGAAIGLKYSDIPRFKTVATCLSVILAILHCLFTVLLITYSDDIADLAGSPLAAALVTLWVPTAPLIVLTIAFATAQITAKTTFIPELAIGAISVGIGLGFPLADMGKACYISSFSRNLIRSALTQLGAVSRRFRIAAVLVLSLLWILDPGPIYAPLIPAPPRNIMTLDSMCSSSGILSVIRDATRPHHALLMRSGHSLLGGIWEQQNQIVFSAFHLQEVPVLVKDLEVQSALAVGAGVGILPASLAIRGATVDVVELDKGVLDLSLKRFPQYLETEGINLHHMDGRDFIDQAVSQTAQDDQNEGARYNAVVIDAFAGGFIPSRLYSVEALRQVKKLMHPRGVVALNVVDLMRGEQMGLGTELVARSAKTVFDHVRVFSESVQIGQTNQLILASGSPIDFREPVHADYLDDPLRKTVFDTFLQHELSLSGLQSSVSPGLFEEELQARSKWGKYVRQSAEAHWKAMRNLLPVSVWLQDSF